MKKIVAVLLVMTLVLSGISAVSATETRTWGADNLNNSSGDLVIGFLGGSITEGCGAATKDDRWSTLVVNGYFKKNFPNKNVIERNASIGGTNSQDGMIRMRRNLELDSASTPDVVFVEFAVNDAGPGGHGNFRKNGNGCPSAHDAAENPRNHLCLYNLRAFA